MVAVFLAEALVTLLLLWLLPPLGEWLVALMDSTFLTLLVIPLLWRWMVMGDRQRQRMEESLRLFRVLVDESNDTLEIIDPETARFLDVNEKGPGELGYTRAEYLSLRVFDVDPSIDPSTWPQLRAKIREAGSLCSEGSHRRKDGTLFPIEFNSKWVRLDRDYIVTVVRDISARKQAEAELHLQSAALTAAADSIIITDREGTIVWVNPAFTTLTAYASAETIGKNPRDLVKSGQQEPAVYEQLWQTILAGRIWHGELINRRKDGSFYPEEQTITPVRNAAGEITHFIDIKRDLTKRNQTDATLRRSEWKQRQLAQQLAMEKSRLVAAQAVAKVGSWETDVLTREVIWSDETHRIFETNPSDFKPTHQGFLQFVHPDDRAMVDEAFIHSLAIRSPCAIEHRLLMPDGRIKIVEERWQMFFDDNGRPLHPVGTCQDVTDRKRAEKALQHSEEHYRALFENNPLPMWLYDVETFRFIAVNESAVQHYGYTREEFLGMTVKQIRTSEDIPAMVESVAQRQTEAKSTGECRHRQKDGTIIHVEIVSKPLVFDGRQTRLVLANDITEKKLIEEKFFHAQRLESIGMLAAGIAHDLNNVLAPIVFAAPMLRDSLYSPRDLKILDTLERSAGRGAGLVKQILGFAHTAAGELRPTQVKHLVQDIISVIEATFPKSIQLQHQISSDLWLVQGNTTQIHQVLLNLCVNARDAMPQGGTLRIAAANRRLNAAEADAIPGALSGAWLMLEVADTGTGIPPKILEDIWQPFFTTKGVGKGTGLGLSTIRGIVTSHHGFVELQTEVGRGSTFRVFLPAVESESPRPRSALPLDIPEGQGELILVVEDDALIRDIVADILRKHGYRVVSCVDGVEAITLFNAQPSAISLVVTDVDMPRLDGVALARTLLQFRPDLRLIAISGLPNSETDASGLPAIKKLVHEFLLKPFKAEDLLSAVHRLLHPHGRS